MNFRDVATRFAPRLLVISGIAGLVVFVGLQLASGEPPEPTTPAGDPIVTFPTVLPNPTPPPQILRPVAPSTVVIEGKEVPLPPDMVYTRASGIGYPAVYGLIRYDSNPADLVGSWIMLDLSGKVLTTNVLPEDQLVFEEFLLTAGLLFTPTPTPVNRVVVAGQEVSLPEGMTYQQIINPNRPGQKTFALIFRDSSGVSRVALDENGDILASEVISAHTDLFRPLLPEPG
jgi:hypothetical protein